MKLLFKFAAICALSAMAACSATPDGEVALDPYENVNRSVHAFNKGVDSAVLRPAAQAYGAVTPGLVRHLVGNAINMLEMPAIFANRVLQGDAEGALASVGRFGVNVVMGGVLLDPATEMGLPHEPTDFGATLATWGAPSGVYVEAPLLGPGYVRDHLGRVVDTAFSPLTYITGVPVEASAGGRVLQLVHERNANAAAIDRVIYESEDSYAALRDAYIQLRRRQLSGGATEESLPDVFQQE